MDDEIARYNYTMRVDKLIASISRTADEQKHQAELLKAYFPYYMQILEDIVHEYEDMYGV